MYTDESKGIFKSLSQAVAERAGKMSHDFAITAWACAVDPKIVADTKATCTGVRCLQMEKCVRKLLSHDIDGEEDGGIDGKVDLFFDELKHFQDR